MLEFQITTNTKTNPIASRIGLLLFDATSSMCAKATCFIRRLSHLANEKIVQLLLRFFSYSLILE